MPAIGAFFVVLPVLAILSFTAFAACRAQRPKAVRALAYPFLALGLICGLPSAGAVVMFVFF
ncbi:hypothetical protein [Streptomyces sp. NBC_01506]|uniref:hypothetical protein n=1 Tax=Streptomyces sp. NBC_01506 TaxID=2903887 RepID=UPI003868317F